MLKNKIVLLGIGALILIGGGVYYTMSSGSMAALSGAPAISMADCKYDTDVCKFMIGWQDVKQYSAVSTMTAPGEKPYESLFETDGDRTHVVTKQGGKEVMANITIGDVTYMKDEQDGKWWKILPEKAKDYKDVMPDTSDYKPEIDTTESEDTTVYTKVGTEPCGKFTCFKYEVTYKDNKDSKEYWWFDNSEYKLRKMRTEGTDKSVSEMTYNYDKPSIKEPSQVKEGSMFDAAMSNSGMSASEAAEMKKQVEEAQKAAKEYQNNPGTYSPPAEDSSNYAPQDTSPESSEDTSYDTGGTYQE